MKTQNKSTKAMALMTLTAVCALIVTAWQTRQVLAIQDSEDFPSDFGFIDVGAGQTARLSVVSLRRQHPPDPEDGRHARRVRLTFDVYGQPPPNPDAPTCLTLYRFLRRESCDVTLMPGEAASWDFTASQDTKIAASIHSLGGPDTREGPTAHAGAHLAATLEVREGLRTIFVVPGVAKGFNPQPDPPGQTQ